MRKRWIQVAVVFTLAVGAGTVVLACDECGALGTHEMVNVVPVPQVTQLEPNDDLLTDRDYYRVNEGEALNFYNAPGGTVISGWKAGDNFVTVYETQGDWGRVGVAIHRSTGGRRRPTPPDCLVAD